MEHVEGGAGGLRSRRPTNGHEQGGQERMEIGRVGPISILFLCGSRVNRPGNVYPLVPCLSLNINVSPRTGWGGLCGSGSKLTLDSRSAPRSWYSRAATGLCSRLNILDEDDDKYATNLHPGSLSPAYTRVHYQFLGRCSSRG